MDKLLMQSHDVIGSNVRKIAQLFPHCVTERLGKDGKPELAIDFEKLQAELSNEIIAEGEERYQFTWPDKRATVRLANTPTTMTLRPCREESVDFDNTQNLYIEGDNLDVLKVLRETYLGKVKMIYIDPPYNTGNDFVYNDDFTESYSKFAESCKVYDEDGNLQFNPKSNGESNGRFHTDWLNMIYPRLKVARDMLTKDGIIFVSINDCEVENLIKVCNEIFGESNFLVNCIWINGRTSASHFTNAHEYVIGYAKNLATLPFFEYKGKGESISDRTIKKPGAKNPLSDISFPSGVEFECEDKIFPRSFGKNEPVEIVEGVMECENRKLKHPITIRAAWAMADMIKAWLRGETVYDQKGQLVNRFFFKENGVLQYEKQKGTIHPNTIISNITTKMGSSVVDALVSNGVFSFPKPVDLIKYFMPMVNDDDIVLDFFSGSATTAHAVMKLNAEDGGNRKFIMVQLPEKTDEKSEANKAGYKNICEIGKERIRRAGKKIKEEAGLQAQNLDTGFRVLKLDSSNMEDVYYTPQEFELQSLFNENVKPDRTGEDLLFQVMLDLGVELSASVRSEELRMKSGHTATIYNVDEGYLMATFDRDIDEATITEIAKRQPVYFVMRDASAASDNVIDNFEQIFRHYSTDTVCRII